MSKLEDLLAQLDDEAAEAIKAEFLAAQSKAARLERDLNVTKKGEFREKFPRAMAAYDKGRVSLPDDPSDDALLAFLKAKEEEYEDLGVPIPGATGRQEAEDEGDPSAAFGAPVGGGAPGPKVDYVREVLSAVRDNTPAGREKAALLLTNLNMEEGYQSPKLQKIVEELNAKPVRV